MRKATVSALFVAVIAGSSGVFSCAIAAGAPVPAATTTSDSWHASNVATSVAPRPTLDKWEILDLARKDALPAGNYRVTFNADEVSGLIDAALASKKVRWFVDAAAADFNDDGTVNVRAHVLRPFKGWVSAVVTPTVVDGEVRLGISSAWYGYFPVPASFVERVGNFLLKKDSPDDWLSVPGIRWNDVAVGDDSISLGFSSVAKGK